MRESRPQSVLFVELSAPTGQTAALERLLSSSDCNVLRGDGIQPSPQTAEWLSKTIEERRPSLALFSIGVDALQADSCLWDILHHRCDVPIIVAAQIIDPPQVRTLLRSGVSDFILPPFHPSNVLPRIWRATDDRLSAQQAPAAPTTAPQLRLFGLLGDSPAFLSVSAKLPSIASCDVTVLVCGETGTGKELIARAIHYLSRRRNKPFVPVDCAAIPAELAESELFGHERGAFTGAVTRTAGLVAAARDGTIFLDEVDALPLSVQAKLLRFLQQKEYRCLGSTEVRKADVRVISATNTDLRERVWSARFREDLFYRLNVLELRLPPLRERPPDIALLARHFVAKYRAEFDRPAQDLSPGALHKLLMHPWPGNVRELENVIQAAVALCETLAITGSDIHFSAREREAPVSFRQAKAEAVTEFEKSYIERLLRANRGNITEAARAAKKHRRAFWELMRKYRIDTAQFKAIASEESTSSAATALPNRYVVAGDGH